MPSKPATHTSPAHTHAREARRAERERRLNAQPNKRLLWTQRYRRFRQAVLQQRPVCEDCQRLGAIDIHHKRGLATHPQDLCDPEQVFALCHACHSIRTARGE